MNKYLELAKICKSVYAGPINHKLLTIDNEPIQYQKIIHGSLGRGFCRLFWNDKKVVIAFRGTREIVDWRISNFNCLPVNVKTHEKDLKHIKVHSGFQKTLNFTDKTTKIKSLEALIKHLEENGLFNGSRKIIITGHSLGGALAILCVVKLRQQFYELISSNLESVILFGSPAVGLKKFKEYYGELNYKTIRIINGSDIVPFTPPLFYYHVGESIWYNSKSIYKNTNWLIRLLHSLRLPYSKFTKDHSMEKYIEILSKITP
jgi:hypothetical protein